MQKRAQEEALKKNKTEATEAAEVEEAKVSGSQ